MLTEAIMKFLKKNGMQLILKKPHFMQPNMELLGRYKNEVYVDEVKIEKGQNARRLATRKKLRCFSVFASYCQRFIKDFARVPCCSPKRHPKTWILTGQQR